MKSSMSSSTFPDRAKVATVVLLYEKTENKYTVRNFRPVSLLNCFSKIYENFIKNHIVNSMNNTFLCMFQHIGKDTIFNMC